ncbi:MAG TPA: Crp/Fnr family transcriptional regulator [Steroidobacteraceae bacterium]|jgi:CRP-like cAMP-binding protein|nr:Crp/Fnr family transcriptional regulator [Steroidobacteraceae bacterium]
MAGAKQFAVPNRLLGALPRKEYQKLLPILEPVTLTFGEVLYESQSQIRHVYFPYDCFVSMLTTVDTGRAAEVGLIGSEGMIGVPMALGAAVSPFKAVVQGGGTAMRLATGDFRRNFSQSAALKREVFLFTHLLMIQIAQTAACNRYHVVTQRMARWMLMTRDRVNSNEFRITQDFLALMLGVRRTGVSAAMSDLRERKLIVYRRGTIRILDHDGLVSVACGCYKTVRDTYDVAQAHDGNATPALHK